MGTFTQKTSKLIVKNSSGDLVQILPEVTTSQISHNSNAFTDWMATVVKFTDVVNTTSNGAVPKVTNTNGFLKGDGTWAIPEGTYSHPTSPGNKHIPSGGSSGQHLIWASDGTASWADHWDHPTTSATNGPTSNQTPGFGATFKIPSIKRDTYGHVSALSSINVTIPSTLASATNNGLMSSADYSSVQAFPTTYAPISSPTFTGVPKLSASPTSTNDHAIADVNYVLTKIDSKLAENDAMIYKGTVAAPTSLPATHNKGWTYKASAAFTIPAGTSTYTTARNVEIGDMLICNTDDTSANNDHWDVIQGNIDGAVTGPTSATNLNIAVFDGTTGKIIKDGGKTVDSLVHPTTAGNKHVPSGGSTGQHLVWSANGVAKWENMPDEYVHPTDSGYKHIPSGGTSTSQILGWESDGTAKWVSQYSHPTTPGNKHVPSGGAANQYLVWSTNGVAKWENIPAGYTHPVTSGNKHVPSGGTTGQHLTWDSDGTAKWENMPASYVHPTFATATGVPTANATSLKFGSTFQVNQITRNTEGHVSAITNRTVKIPNEVFTTCNSTAAGTIGLVPAPAAGDQAKFLNAGSNWQELPIHVVVTSVDPSVTAPTCDNNSVIIYITD